MIYIDCAGGGGQMLRTAIAMSALTGKQVGLSNIRGARTKPGLKVQHMEGVRIVGQLCGADISGLQLGATDLVFNPGKFQMKDLEARIETAGSVGLLLQNLLLATTKLEKSINVSINGGGTWNKWAPPVTYFENVLFPLLKETTKINIAKDGFYPTGGAKVSVHTNPWQSYEFNLTENSDVENIYGISLATKQLQQAQVAERQATKAREIISKQFNIMPEIKTKYVDALNAGSGIILWAKKEKSIIAGDATGERGKRAEDVGKEAANYLVREKDSVIDRHAADMLLPYMALAGKGTITTSKITNHIYTNIQVIEKFLDVKFDIRRNTINCTSL